MADYLYPLQPPARVRPASKPMVVLALGLSRTGTDSLRTALTHLGYEDCYHGFSLIDNEGWHDARAWYDLLLWKSRSLGSSSGSSVTSPQLPISTATFDKILGNCMAITDIPAVLFARELLDAYPEAKVILNRRPNLEEWKGSFRNTTLAAEQSLIIRTCSYFVPELYWMQSVFKLCISIMFQGDFEKNAERAYQQHYRELEEKLKHDRRGYIDWEAREGWAPICKMLGKKVPKIEYPRKNQRKAHDDRIAGLGETEGDEGVWEDRSIDCDFIDIGRCLMAEAKMINALK